MSVPNTFAAATSAIPLANLDADFAYYDAAFQIAAGVMEVNYTFRLEDPTDTTKKAEFVISGITTGTTRQYTMPNVSGALVSLGNLAQTFIGATTFTPSNAGSTLIFGSTNGTGAITLGQSTAAQTVSIAGGATAAAVTKTINIGAAGVSTSVTNINYGSSVTGALVTQTWNAGANNMRLDSSGNLGLGVTPSAWASTQKVIQMQGGSISSGSVLEVYLSQNVYYGGSPAADRYVNTGTALSYGVANGAFTWRNAPSGTAGAAITFTQAMTLDASGNLIVGGTSSAISGAGRGNVTINGASTAIMALSVGGTAKGWMYHDNTNMELNAGSSGAMIMYTAGAERARIDSSGNFQIGSIGGSSKLNVFSDNPLTLFNAAATSSFTVSAGQNSQISNYFGTGSSISFRTNANGGGVAERVRIDSSGNLLVGQTSWSFSGNGTQIQANGRIFNTSSTDYNFELAGAQSGRLRFYTSAGGSGTTVGSITVDTTNTLYNTSSDYRLKNITGPITTSGAYIDSLKPVEGTWKADGSTFVGLIAHETQEVSRTTVATGTKDGEQMQGMDYSSAEIIANLIAELQSLRKRLAAAGI